MAQSWLTIGPKIKIKFGARHDSLNTPPMMLYGKLQRFRHLFIFVGRETPENINLLETQKVEFKQEIQNLKFEFEGNKVF